MWAGMGLPQVLWAPPPSLVLGYCGFLTPLCCQPLDGQGKQEAVDQPSLEFPAVLRLVLILTHYSLAGDAKERRQPLRPDTSSPGFSALLCIWKSLPR